MTREEKIQRIKHALGNSVVFDTYEGICLMFGNKEIHYSWFPGPGEIKLSVNLIGDFKITVDSISIQNMSLEQTDKFLKELERAIYVGKLIERFFSNFEQ